MTDHRPLQSGFTRFGIVPLARRENLVTTDASGELIIYDTTTRHLHQLNRASAAVFRHCDGRHTVESVARLVTRELGEAIDVATVRLAISKLAAAGLFEGAAPEHGPTPVHSRRRLLRRVATGAAVTVPMIVSVTAPAAAEILTSNCKDLYQSCEYPSDCCTGNCTWTKDPSTGRPAKLCDVIDL